MTTSKTISTIYIVDDDDLHRTSLKKLLTLSGNMVVDFESADQFLSISQVNHPCVLILDMRMPDKSGIDLQVELAKSNIKLPIIFLSGQSHTEEVIASFKNGAFDFLLKPFDTNNLLSSIQKALEVDIQQMSSNQQKDQLMIDFNSLTEREKEVYELLNQGFMNTEIAAKLNITPRTIKAHKAQIMGKMHANSVQDLLKKWLEIHK